MIAPYMGVWKVVLGMLEGTDSTSRHRPGSISDMLAWIASPARRTIAAGLGEVLVTGLWAYIDPAFVTQHAGWFVIVGAGGLLAMWFLDQTREFIAWKSGQRSFRLEILALMYNAAPFNGVHPLLAHVAVTNIGERPAAFVQWDMRLKKAGALIPLRPIHVDTIDGTMENGLHMKTNAAEAIYAKTVEPLASGATVRGYLLSGSENPLVGTLTGGDVVTVLATDVFGRVHEASYTVRDNPTNNPGHYPGLDIRYSTGS